MIDESKQVGSTFGQRLCSAIDHVFTVSDYEHIIILGNDCLDLTLSEITQSAALLAQGNQVIGLTQCDGAYLIGINRAHYTRRGLESIGWQTDALVSDLMAYFSSTAVQLEDKIELNHLSRLAHLATTVLCQCIARLLSHVRATLSVASRILLHHIYQVQIPILRGPPQVI